MRVLLLLFLLVLSASMNAQQRCGTVEYEKLRNIKSQKETKEQFEQWMQGALARRSKAARADRTAGSTLIVPLVIHVIHNGESVGTGTNISDDQILSQIDVTNNDFQRLNADKVLTPSEFTPVAGNMDVQFVLAKRDPDGLATSGIVRVQGTQSSWSMNDDHTLKALSYWPAEDYLNIWIVNLSGGFLGYTQLPVSNTLLGLSQSSNDRLTDGVVIHYQSFGSADAGNFDLLSRYDKGRTVTHEVGHYFGLRHIWGDDSGCVTDYVDDTPFQSSSTNGCPTGVIVSCNNDNMYQNYLDYTDDACMNIFTQGQVARMMVVAENSPRRATLANSKGALPPTPVPDDLGVKSILNPLTTACSGSISPSILLRNYGTTDISSAKVQFRLNGSLIDTQNLPATLTSASEIVINFNPGLVSGGNTYTMGFKIVQVNGGVDGNSGNDELSISTTVPVNAALPLVETFESTPTTWSMENPSAVNGWENISLGSTNAMYLNFFNDQNLDTYSRLVSPVIDLTNASTANLSFDYAYAVYPGVTDERLRVLIYLDCAYTSNAIEVFNKSGTSLATAPSEASSFSPSTSQWKRSIICLESFLGQKIQIAFEGTNYYGNNLYLDNVSILDYPVTAFELTDLLSPSPISCHSTTEPVITVKNLGNTIITSMDVSVYLNGGNGITQSIAGISIAPGETENITLGSFSFTSGDNTLDIAVKNPNGTANMVDSISFVRTINSSADIIPLRENFENSFVGRWALASPQLGQNWFLAQTNYNHSLIFNSFTNTNIGEKAWLVSPVLDFSGKQKASLFFDTSYGKRATGSEKLEVYASSDCGETFSSVVFSKSGSSLSNTVSDDGWLPTQTSDWARHYVNLDAFADKTDIRFAFVATNDNGNNLYLDNVEFFEDDNIFPVNVETPYKIYGGIDSPVRITFNLNTRQDVLVQIYSLQGMLVADQTLTDILNQTYTVDIPNSASGVYVVRLQIGTEISSDKVWIGF